MMTPIYRWSGEYFGFIRNGRLFDSSANYLGWLSDEGRVWRTDGTFLGELSGENYILRRTSMMCPTPRTPRIPPIKPIAPIPKLNRPGRTPRSGRVDALNEFH